MTVVQTKFIHCDCDCFYAAIEIRDDPALRELPVAVGGDETRRGVISTCNYEARRYGVHSAMASATARRLCRDLIIIPPHFDKYKEASRRINLIYQDYTDLIEPLSLDEAFLDVTHSTVLRGSGQLIARDIRRRVRDEIGITLSAGIAPNKFLAKIASDWNKPDGQFAITPPEVKAFMLTLPVKKIHGVGKVTAKRMQLMGIDTCADLQTYSKPQLLELFGSFGDRLYSLCRGIDERGISQDREPRSISVEQTYSTDLLTVEQCLAALPELVEQLEHRLGQRKGGGPAINKQYIKLKFSNFVSTTAEQTAGGPDLEGYQALCRTGFERGGMPVRLIGVGVRLRQDGGFHQLQLPLTPQ